LGVQERWDAVTLGFLNNPPNFPKNFRKFWVAFHKVMAEFLESLMILRKSLVVGLLSVTALMVAAPTQAAEFGFYLRSDLAKMVQRGESDRVTQQEPRIVNLMRTACGPGAMAKVSTMPKFTRHEALIPEKVVEVDARNRTLRRWAKPLNSTVVAVSGDRILVETAPNQSYWIGRDGSLELETQARSLTLPINIPYKKHPEFGASGIYSQKFIDIDSDRDRRIIADAPCT
jgi:hypothetical protein